MLRSTTRSRRLARALGAALPLTLLLAACEPEPGCRPTTTNARDAAAVDLSSPDRSGILSAVLTSDGDPVPGARLEFWIEHKRYVAAGERLNDKVGVDRTGRRGRASVSLRERAYRQTVNDVFAEKWGAVFRGTTKYCGSYDEARFSTVNLTEDDADRGGGSRARRSQPSAPGSAERTTLPVDPLGIVRTITSARGSL